MLEPFSALILGGRVQAPPEISGDSIPRGVTLRRGRLVPWIGGILARMQGPAAAVTLGRTIVLQPGVRLTPTLLAHELAHVQQWESVPLFPLRYALATLKYGYRDNPFEVEAREYAASFSSSDTDYKSS